MKGAHQYFICLCKYCLYYSASPSDLVGHHIQSHSDKEPFAFCQNCAQRTSIDSYVEHCKECFVKPAVGWKSTKTRNPLFMIRHHMRRDLRTLPCELCGSERSQCQHIEFSEDEGDRENFADKEAAKTYSVKASAKRRRVIKNKANFLCSQCPSSYVIKRALDDHVDRVHLNKKVSFVCDVCSKVYQSKDSLRMHKDEQHGVPRFPCPHCGLMFKSANQRWAHKNKEHKNHKA